MNTELTWSNSPIHEEIRNMNTQPTPSPFATDGQRTTDAECWMNYCLEAEKQLTAITKQRDEAREYADRLAEGLPEGMLPKDVEVLREANLGLATELATITARSRAALAEAIRLTLMENLNLCDGNVCTLKRLKDAIGFDLDSLENSDAKPRRHGL